MVARIFDLETQAFAVAQEFSDPVEMLATDRDLVVREADDEPFRQSGGLPLPTVEPRQRKALNGAVELGQNQAAMIVLAGATARFGVG